MTDEPIPGATPEELATAADANGVFNQYLPIAENNVPGGLSSLEQEDLRTLIATIVEGDKTISLSEVKDTLQAVLERWKTRPLAQQIAAFIKRYQEDPHARTPQVYYAGKLITDQKYPDNEKGYGELDLHTTVPGIHAVPATPEEKKGGLLIEVFRNEQGKVRAFPILEKDKQWRPWSNWTATVELPPGFFPDGDTPTRATDVLMPGFLMAGGYTLMEKARNDKGNWEASVRIEGRAGEARNFERSARAFAKCLSYDVTKEPPSPGIRTRVSSAIAQAKALPGRWHK